MSTRHPSLPALWLMTDERVGDALWDALDALPRGAGIVFRHYATPAAERRTLFARIARIARHKRLILVSAGAVPLGKVAGVHGPGRKRAGQIRTWPAHSRAEALAGIRAGADLLFVSPVFDTRSHPGAAALGPKRAAAIMRGLRTPAIALGGMNARRFRRLRAFHGWAAIDAWIDREPRQKRKAVPI